MKATFVASLLYGVHCMDADIDTVVGWSNRTNRSLSSKASGPKDLQVSRLPACLRTRNVVTVAHIPPFYSPDVASTLTSSSSVP